MRNFQALLVAPHCTNSSSKWFSPGRSAKLAQVVTILQQCGYSTVLINTCPVQSNKIHSNQVILSNKISGLSRLFDFICYDLKRLSIKSPGLIWVYNSRFPEALVLWRLKKCYPHAVIIIEIEDLPAARKENALWRGWLDWFSTRWLVRKSNIVTCVSLSAVKVLRQHITIKHNHALVLPPLLSQRYLETVQHRSFSAFSRRYIRVLYAGGYEPEKGVDDLLWAFKHLPSSKYRLHLVGPSTPNVRKYALAYPHIFVHGLVNQDRLYDLYSHADVVVNPHRAILHGSHVFPFKTIEQAASGALPLLSIQLGANHLDLPQACLFKNREGLLSSLIKCKEIWKSYHHDIDNFAFRMRKNYSLSAVAEQIRIHLEAVCKA